MALNSLRWVGVFMMLTGLLLLPRRAPLLDILRTSPSQTAPEATRRGAMNDFGVTARVLLFDLALEIQLTFDRIDP
jgi:hypothetical protein